MCGWQLAKPAIDESTANPLDSHRCSRWRRSLREMAAVGSGCAVYPSTRPLPVGTPWRARIYAPVSRLPAPRICLRGPIPPISVGRPVPHVPDLSASTWERRFEVRRFDRYRMHMQLSSDEEALQATLDELGAEAKSQLAAAIGKARLDIAWFDEPQLVEDALAWVHKKIDAIEADREAELLELRSALRRVRNSLHP